MRGQLLPVKQVTITEKGVTFARRRGKNQSIHEKGPGVDLRCARNRLLLHHLTYKILLYLGRCL